MTSFTEKELALKELKERNGTWGKFNPHTIGTPDGFTKIEYYTFLMKMASGNKELMESVLNKIHEIKVSWSLGRGFMETWESFEARNPAFAEYCEWMTRITLSPKYEFVSA